MTGLRMMFARWEFGRLDECMQLRALFCATLYIKNMFSILPTEGSIECVIYRALGDL
jgi:hypothetical protein